MATNKKPLHIRLMRVSEEATYNEVRFGHYVLENISAGSWFEVGIEEYHNENERLEKEIENASGNRLKELNAQRKALKERFVDVRYVVQLVGNHSTFVFNGYNPAMGRGVVTRRVAFSPFLVGGGKMYIEAFHENEQPRLSASNGIFLSAVANRETNVSQIAWTDAEAEPRLITSNQVVQVDSTVLLHIYTDNLYGQELNVEIEGIEGAKLCEVNVHQVQNFERGFGRSGHLAHSEENNEDTFARKVYVQKAIVKIKISEGWRIDEVKPIIKGYPSGHRYDSFPANDLRISTDSRESIHFPAPGSGVSPARVGQVTVNIPVFHPCKFTAIEVSSKGKGSSFDGRVFDEKNITAPLPIIVIGGRNDFNVALVDYNTQECMLSANPHTSNVAQLRHHNGQTEALDIAQGGTFGFNLAYDYSNFGFIRNMFASPQRVVQASSFRVATCRHRREVPVRVYPDVKYSVKLKVGTERSSTDDWSEEPQEVLNPVPDVEREHFTGARPEELGTDVTPAIWRVPRTDLKVELSFGYQWNDGQSYFNLGAHYKEALNDTFALFGAVKETVNRISGREKATAEGDTRQFLPRGGRRTFLEISSPAAEIGGTWQYDLREDNQIGRTGGIYIGLNPLIMIRGGINLIAAAKFIPGAGKVIKAVTGVSVGATWLLNLSRRVEVETDMTFTLYGYGRVNIEASANFGSGRVNGDAVGTVGLGLELMVKASLKINISVRGTDRSSSNGRGPLNIKGKVAGNARTSVSVRPRFGLSRDEGLFMDWTGQFDGLTVTVSGEASISRGDYDGERGTGGGIGIGGEGSFEVIEPSDVIDLGRTYPLGRIN